MFFEGNISWQRFPFSPVGVMWLTESVVQLCYTHGCEKYSTLGNWNKNTTMQRGGNIRKPNLVVWFDGSCSSGNVHICHGSFSYNIDKSIRGDGFLWEEENTGSILFSASHFKLTNFDKWLLRQGGYVWLVSICWLVGNPIVNINVLLCWIFCFCLAVFMHCLGLDTKST